MAKPRHSKCQARRREVCDGCIRSFGFDSGRPGSIEFVGAMMRELPSPISNTPSQKVCLVQVKGHFPAHMMKETHLRDSQREMDRAGEERMHHASRPFPHCHGI